MTNLETLIREASADCSLRAARVGREAAPSERSATAAKGLSLGPHQALTETETHEYIAERLRIAGAKWQIFTPDAMDAVHLASRGIPRIMNLVCEHALIVAYVEQSQQVTKAMVESVAAELELETAPFLISTAAMGGVLPPLRSAADGLQSDAGF